MREDDGATDSTVGAKGEEWHEHMQEGDRVLRGQDRILQQRARDTQVEPLQHYYNTMHRRRGNQGEATKSVPVKGRGPEQSAEEAAVGDYAGTARIRANKEAKGSRDSEQSEEEDSQEEGREEESWSDQGRTQGTVPN